MYLSFVFDFVQISSDEGKPKGKKPASEKPKYNKNPVTPVSTKKDDIFNDGDDEDDLFGATTSKPPTTSNTSSNTGKNVPAATVTSKNDKSSSLFGEKDANDDDDDEDDDLFSTSKSIKQPSKPSTTTTTKSAATPKNALFSSGSDEDDLFAAPSSTKPSLSELPSSEVDQSKQEAVKKEGAGGDEQDSPAAKPRKPVGGVSMFGGIDPFAAKKNLKSSTAGTVGSVGTNAPKKDKSLFILFILRLILFFLFFILIAAFIFSYFFKVYCVLCELPLVECLCTCFLFFLDFCAPKHEARYEESRLKFHAKCICLYACFKNTFVLFGVLYLYACLKNTFVLFGVATILALIIVTMKSCSILCLVVRTPLLKIDLNNELRIFFSRSFMFS